MATQESEHMAHCTIGCTDSNSVFVYMASPNLPLKDATPSYSDFIEVCVPSRSP